MWQRRCVQMSQQERTYKSSLDTVVQDAFGVFQ